MDKAHRIVLQFQSTLLVRGATLIVKLVMIRLLFQSTLLVRGATEGVMNLAAASGISIHAPRERSDYRAYAYPTTSPISIHAPRERSDLKYYKKTEAKMKISIHAPRERSDTIYAPSIYRFVEFQSTLLVRGATESAIRGMRNPIFQSTLLVRGATMK